MSVLFVLVCVGNDFVDFEEFCGNVSFVWNGWEMDRRLFVALMQSFLADLAQSTSYQQQQILPISCLFIDLQRQSEAILPMKGRYRLIALRRVWLRRSCWSGEEICMFGVMLLMSPR